MPVCRSSSEPGRGSRGEEGGCRIPELLAPAGNLEKLVTAVHYGADAVYLGGRKLSLRARAGNFDSRELARGLAHAHDHGVRVYVTVNVFARNQDLEGLARYLCFLRDTGVDGLIVADPGILRIVKQTVPELAVHLSTQANVTNREAVRFWGEQGVRRVNLARELGLEEIRQIRSSTDLELEVFVHGALCISYSGRCLLSTYFTGRDANQGDCAHPCRYAYRLVEEKRPGQYFPVEEDERGTYIFNARDLCLLGQLPLLVDAGVDSVKIEGRMKSVGYVGSVVRIYRAALDWIAAQAAAGTPPARCTLPESFAREMNKVGTRGQTENFFSGPPSSADMLYDTMRTSQPWGPVGIILATDPPLVDVRNVLQTGDRIEYLGHDIEPVSCVVSSMRREDGTRVDRANPGNRVVIETVPRLAEAEIHAILRKELSNS